MEISLPVLKTGLTPSASGSAYLELEPSSTTAAGLGFFSDPPSALKLTCTVHGPRPLPRSAPFTPQLLLSTYIKFAPFASRHRRGYVRDANERDLAVHLETALRGVLIGERWPKSGVDVVVTVLEGEEDRNEDGLVAQTGVESGENKGWGMMSLLSGCITVASAAIIDAGIDCVDIVTGGVAAAIQQSTTNMQRAKSRAGLDESQESDEILADPCPAEHGNLQVACVVGYVQSRDELTEIWVKGNASDGHIHKPDDQPGLDALLDRAVQAATAARLVVVEAIKESTESKIQKAGVDQT